MGDRPDALWEPVVVIPVGPHVMRVCGGRIHSNHKGRPARGADRGSGIDVGVALPSRSEGVEVGGLDVLHAVDAKVQAEILADDPDNVWPVLGVGREDE